MPRRTLILLLVMAAVILFWVLRQRYRRLPEAYVSERTTTLWSSTAQVRQPVSMLHYGEKVSVIARRGELVSVRTSQGLSGWLEARLLMEPPLWQRSAQLLAQARTMPVQARGHTKVLSNVRVEVGRSGARIYRFSRAAPVEILARAVVEWTPPAGEESGAGGKDAEQEQAPRREDWLLVRGQASTAVGLGGTARPEETGAPPREEEAVPVAGWVLSHFVELDSPGPVRDLASSSGIHVIGWFELDRVSGAGEGEKPQYLAVGTRGGEGQACDFTLLRVYTWGSRRKRYETAYLESDVCGFLPVRVSRDAARDPEFRFQALGRAGKEERLYRVRQTVVRRIREEKQAAAKGGHKAP